MRQGGWFLEKSTSFSDQCSARQPIARPEAIKPPDNGDQGRLRLALARLAGQRLSPRPPRRKRAQICDRMEQ
jgi:hypothetical protein